MLQEMPWGVRDIGRPLVDSIHRKVRYRIVEDHRCLPAAEQIKHVLAKYRILVHRFSPSLRHWGRNALRSVYALAVRCAMMSRQCGRSAVNPSGGGVTV